MKVYIKAIAYNLPEKVMDNEQICREFPEWTVEKIDKKIGIRQRHIAAEGETASDLAVGAAEKLFSDNNIDSTGAQALASALQHNSSLLSLDLYGFLFFLSSSGNKIGSSGSQGFRVLKTVYILRINY